MKKTIKMKKKKMKKKGKRKNNNQKLSHNFPNKCKTSFG